MIDLFQNKKWQPMLLKEIAKPFNSAEYYFELKFDGERAILFVTPDKIIVKTRNSNDVAFKFPELESIKTIVSKPTIFDGEIVCFVNGKPSFSKLSERSHLKDASKIKYQSIKNPLTFICFDILYENKNLVELPLKKRKEILNNYPNTDVFIKNKYIVQNGKKLFQNVKSMNLEGIIAKKIDSPYLINERSAYWLKIKNLKREQFYIIGYKEKQSKYVISLYLAEKKDNKFFFVGKATLAKKSHLYQQLLLQPKINKSPCLNLKEKFIYLKPTLKCFVSYLEKTPNNHLRQPIIK